MGDRSIKRKERRANRELDPIEALETLRNAFSSKRLPKRFRRAEQELGPGKLGKLLENSVASYFESEELKLYQAELIKMQAHLERTGRKLILLFDGRDASGKGGTIRRVARYMNEKRYRIIALGKPNEHQKTEMHMKRYIEQFPRAGEVVLFDRSWYNRAMIEPVMGFCSKKQYRLFMDTVLDFERGVLKDGDTTLIKLYFSVSKEEQARRFERRRNDPLLRWKLSEVDLQAQEHWDEFTLKKYRLLKKTHTEKTPWYVIRSDDKHLARVEAMKIILSSVPYRGRNRKISYTPDPDIVIDGPLELEVMKAQRRETGKYER